MVDEMSREQWQDWQAFVALEQPFEYVREDVRHADLMALLRNVHRDTKVQPQAYTLQDSLLRFGDDLPPGPTRKLDWRTSKANFFRAVGVTGADGKPRATPQPAPRPPRPVRPARVSSRGRR